jgi:hypothetical protein
MADNTSHPVRLAALGQEKKALFFDWPQSLGQWHNVKMHLEDTHDKAMDKQGALKDLKVDKLAIFLGTWVYKDPGSQCGVYFDNVEANLDGSGQSSTINNLPLEIGVDVFETSFAESCTY